MDVTFEPTSFSSSVAHKVITLSVTVLALLCSSTSLWIVRKVPKIPANRQFLSSLAVSDFLQASLVLPLSVTAVMLNSWVISPYIWLIQVCISNLLWITSLYTLAFISIDHYMAITEPAHYLQQFNPRKSFCWVVFIWILSISYCIPLVLIGPQRAVLCSMELAFCLFNHDLLATYSATSISILLPPPLIIFAATALRGLAPDADDHLVVTEQRLLMYKANSAASIVTIAAWVIGLCGTFSHGSPPIFRLVSFWVGLSAPLWRCLCYAIIARNSVKQTYVLTQ